MKKFLILIPLAAGVLMATGCGNGTPEAENVTAKIQSLPAEERFKLIKENTGMSPQMKEVAIDNLPVDQTQKDAWKKELGVYGSMAGGGGAPANPQQGASGSR
jgi:hypothetical protein